MENRFADLDPREVLVAGREVVGDIRGQINKVIVGEDMVPFIKVLLLTPFISGGHLLVRAPVGMGKTTTLDAFARAIGGGFNRIQCRPDMLPSDISGFLFFNQKIQEFEVWHGPAYGANVLLADEINRATPKTLSALLEIMAERRVTIGRQEFELEKFFLVVATRNPLEHEGVYQLPEAALDRFFAQPVLKDVSGDTMGLILNDPLIHEDVIERLARVSPVTSPAELLTIKAAIFHGQHGIHVGDNIRAYIIELWEAVGSHEAVKFGKSPRGAIFLQNASRVVAFMAGRDYVIPEDVQAVAVDILAHRIFMDDEVRYDAARDLSPADIVREAMSDVPCDSYQT
jgi:MoxR-like ATPase